MDKNGYNGRKEGKEGRKDLQISISDGPFPSDASREISELLEQRLPALLLISCIVENSLRCSMRCMLCGVDKHAFSCPKGELGMWAVRKHGHEFPNYSWWAGCSPPQYVGYIDSFSWLSFDGCCAPWVAFAVKCMPKSQPYLLCPFIFTTKQRRTKRKPRT